MSHGGDTIVHTDDFFITPLKRMSVSMSQCRLCLITLYTVRLHNTLHSHIMFAHGSCIKRCILRINTAVCIWKDCKCCIQAQKSDRLYLYYYYVGRQVGMQSAVHISQVLFAKPLVVLIISPSVTVSYNYNYTNVISENLP